MSNVPPEKKDISMAFAVVDVQKKFTISGQDYSAEIEMINKVSTIFRKNGRPVIFIRFDGPSHCSQYDGKDGDEYLPGIISDNKDIVVHKGHMNSFSKSGLADVLKDCGCNTMLIAGMFTQACVIGTYYGALDHQISPYLLVGGTIATEERFNEAAYLLCKTLTLGDVEDIICNKKIPESVKIRSSMH